MLVSYHIQLNGPLPAEVLSGEEPIHLHIYLPPCVTTPSQGSSSGSPAIPIPPRLGSPSLSIREDDIIARDERFFTPQGSPAPLYFTPEVVPPSPTIAASEDALSDTDTDVQPEQQVLPPVQLPEEDLEPGAWVHLQENIMNHVIRRIHDDPQFFPALALQFEGQDTIFGEDRRAFEGLHIVCRRLERDHIKRLVQVDSGELGVWDKFFEAAQRRAEVLQAYENVLRRH